MDDERLRSLIRDVPDFPQPGVVFKDITPLLGDPVAFSTVVDTMVVHFGRGNVDKVVGIEARGFIIAAPVAYHFNAGFVPVRKAGKPAWKEGSSQRRAIQPDMCRMRRARSGSTRARVERSNSRKSS